MFMATFCKFLNMFSYLCEFRTIILIFFFVRLFSLFVFFFFFGNPFRKHKERLRQLFLKQVFLMTEGYKTIFPSVLQCNSCFSVLV